MTTPSYPECQVLFELFAAPRGRVLLGRLNSGRETGRVVRLRELDEATVPRVSEVVEGTGGFTHPELLKLLGIVSDGTHHYLASEYLPGISLFELIARMRARQGGIEVAAAVRIASAALRLVEQAGALLVQAKRPRTRLLFTDCIWIAEYGETLLSEAGVAAYLGSGRAAEQPETGAEAEQRDVFSVAVELYQLASGRLLTGDLSTAVKEHLPAPLAAVLSELFMWTGTPASDSVKSFSTALSLLPSSLMGTDARVAEELRRFVGDVLRERERRLSEYVGGLGKGAGAEQLTRVYSAGSAGTEEPEEPTVEVRGYTRGLPIPISRPASPPRARAAAELSRLLERSRPTPRGSQPDSKLPLRLNPRILVAVAAVVLSCVLVILLVRHPPAWLQPLVSRWFAPR